LIETPLTSAISFLVRSGALESIIRIQQGTD
jgi:hypothetical protein